MDNNQDRDMLFGDLRRANTSRQKPLFEKFPGENNWSATDWGLAMVGEAGEVANAIKKLRRGDGVVEDVMDEVADVVIYADLLANHFGMSLADAVVRKFNKTSEKFDLPHRLRLSPEHHPRGVCPMSNPKIYVGDERRIYRSDKCDKWVCEFLIHENWYEFHCWPSMHKAMVEIAHHYIARTIDRTTDCDGLLEAFDRVRHDLKCAIEAAKEASDE